MSVEDGSLRGWHEPDKSRGLRPVLWAARGAIPRADSAVGGDRRPYGDQRAI